METGNSAPPRASPALGNSTQQSPHSASQNERSLAQENRRSHPKSFQRGGKHARGGRGGGKKGDLGRADWAKQKVDKRQRNDDEQARKRQKIAEGSGTGGGSSDGAAALPIYATKYSEEELKDEQRRPKKKVAVLIGYAGTGYRGMQFVDDHKTIEGDLFKAFVEAGAISKANADDPKKSSFVRCARTDKGVHAAGNVVSLKLIVEDDDIVDRINHALVPQIRVWGIERTNNSFSAYQMVDSRIYEYLIPSHSFLPPHPASFLGRQCEEWARKKGDYDEWMQRQEEVQGYWEKVDDEVIRPILDEYDAATRAILEKALFLHGNSAAIDDAQQLGSETVTTDHSQGAPENLDASASQATVPMDRNRRTEIQEATRRLRGAYLAAKRAYRMPEKRLHRIRDLLKMYVGTKNYHNFTIDKTSRDPSAKRVIKSFVVNETPILINGTEWLSLKVHGQSFMMHQIRKMVGMVALVVRCGTHPSRLYDALGHDDFSIPKAPALGLLLERPVFDSYNKRATSNLDKEAINFDKFKKEMDDFKQKQIYERMYRDEESDNVFGNFFNHIDNFPESAFLFVTSAGIEATKEEASERKGGLKRAIAEAEKMDSDDEEEGSDDSPNLKAIFPKYYNGSSSSSSSPFWGPCDVDHYGNPHMCNTIMLLRYLKHMAGAEWRFCCSLQATIFGKQVSGHGCRLVPTRIRQLCRCPCLVCVGGMEGPSTELHYRDDDDNSGGCGYDESLLKVKRSWYHRLMMELEIAGEATLVEMERRDVRGRMQRRIMYRKMGY
ncbi:hypothetical protein DV737_g1214, partial [Chaetothyriales sp. CBS 132003]